MATGMGITMVTRVGTAKGIQSRIEIERRIVETSAHVLHSEKIGAAAPGNL
jgi:uridine phosphorylase